MKRALVRFDPSISDDGVSKVSRVLRDAGFSLGPAFQIFTSGWIPIADYGGALIPLPDVCEAAPLDAFTEDNGSLSLIDTVEVRVELREESYGSQKIVRVSQIVPTARISVTRSRP